MKKQLIEHIKIPEGVHCEFHNSVLICKKGSEHVSRKVYIPNTLLKVGGSQIKIETTRGNKKIIATIRSLIAHTNNMFKGLDEKFIYEMEICNVHFPMTLKVEKNALIINNFLGEKEKRVAKILPHVNIDIKDKKITVSGTDLESTAQTAANIEKATLVAYRDRRVFQDGIFIISKKGRSII